MRGGEPRPGWVKLGGNIRSSLSFGAGADGAALNKCFHMGLLFLSSLPPLKPPHFISFVELWHKVFLRSFTSFFFFSAQMIIVSKDKSIQVDLTKLC